MNLLVSRCNLSDGRRDYVSFLKKQRTETRVLQAVVASMPPERNRRVYDPQESRVRVPLPTASPQLYGDSRTTSVYSAYGSSSMQADYRIWGFSETIFVVPVPSRSRFLRTFLRRTACFFASVGSTRTRP